MNQRQHYLEALGIDVWRARRPAAAAAPAVSVPTASVSAMPVTAIAVDVPPAAAPADAWQALRAEVSACRRCGLCEGRTQTVFGVGNTSAELLVIGEAPGAEEDRQGEPFVGRAGQLLNSMLRAMGHPRESVYIANILKCRPPGNRDPKPEESAQCRPFLQRQLELLRPRLILAVGRIAAQNLLETEVPIGKLRGRVHAFGNPGTPLVVTYHPAYLLRSPGEKRKAWEDLKLARRELAARQLRQRAAV